MIIRKVVGESMLPALRSGNIVLAKKAKTYQKGDIVIANINDREIIKRVKYVSKNNFYELAGDNQSHSTDSRHFGAVKYTNIEGRVYKVLKLPKFSTKLAVILILVFLAASAVLFAAFTIIKGQNLVRFDSGSASQPIYEKSFALGSVNRNVKYCNNQLLDIYEPSKALYISQPTVIYIHGGGWHLNDKNSEAEQFNFIEPLRSEGFTVVSINYRTVPEYGYPAQIQDVLCAIRYLNANASYLNINPNRIGVFGFSAGGHLAAMVGTLDSNSKFTTSEYTDYSSRVKAVATIAGIFDFTQELKQNTATNIKNMMLTNPVAEASPVNFVSADDPPFLLIHGTNDTVVKSNQDILFANKLQESGVEVQKIVVQNGDHGLLNAKSETTPSKKEIGEQIREFFKTKLLN